MSSQPQEPRALDALRIRPVDAEAISLPPDVCARERALGQPGCEVRSHARASLALGALGGLAWLAATAVRTGGVAGWSALAVAMCVGGLAFGLLRLGLARERRRLGLPDVRVLHQCVERHNDAVDTLETIDRILGAQGKATPSSTREQALDRLATERDELLLALRLEFALRTGRTGRNRRFLRLSEDCNEAARQLRSLASLQVQLGLQALRPQVGVQGRLRLPISKDEKAPTRRRCRKGVLR